MSVWILHTAFSPELTQLPLPFAGLPDLKGVDSEFAMRHLLVALNPDMAPETAARMAEVHWRNFSEMMADDMILVPKPDNSVALAEVVVPYRYEVRDGEDTHSVEIRWVKTDIPKRRLSQLSAMLRDPATLQLVPHADQRKQVYGLLPRPYNRFRKVQWLMVAITIVAEGMWLLGMIKH